MYVHVVIIAPAYASLYEANNDIATIINKIQLILT